MSKRGAGVPAFSRLVTAINKRWYKQKKHRANRKRLRQAQDIENHCDKPLDPRAVD